MVVWIPHTLQLDAIIITCWIILNAFASLAVCKKGYVSPVTCVVTELPDAGLGVHRQRCQLHHEYFTDSVGMLLMYLPRMLFYTIPSLKAASRRAGPCSTGHGGDLRYPDEHLPRPHLPWSYRRELCFGMVLGLTASTWILWTYSVVTLCC